MSGHKLRHSRRISHIHQTRSITHNQLRHTSFVMVTTFINEDVQTRAFHIDSSHRVLRCTFLHYLRCSINQTTIDRNKNFSGSLSASRIISSTSSSVSFSHLVSCGTLFRSSATALANHALVTSAPLPCWSIFSVLAVSVSHPQPPPFREHGVSFGCQPGPTRVIFHPSNVVETSELQLVPCCRSVVVVVSESSKSCLRVAVLRQFFIINNVEAVAFLGNPPSGYNDKQKYRRNKALSNLEVKRNLRAQ